MAISGRTYQIGRGETLSDRFSLKDGDEYTDLTLYTPTLAVERDGGEVTGAGTVSIIAATETTPTKVWYNITSTESALLSEGAYSGKITLTEIASPYTTVEALIFSLIITEDTRNYRIPVNEDTIYDILKVSQESVSRDQLRRIIRMTENRMYQWLPETVTTWAAQYGFPERVVREAEYLAALLLRRELYDNDQAVRQDIVEAQATIQGMTLDTDFDGTREKGNSNEVKIVRAGRDATTKIWDRGRLRMTNPRAL